MLVLVPYCEKPDSNRSQSCLDAGGLRCHIVNRSRVSNISRGGAYVLRPPCATCIRVEMATACAKKRNAYAVSFKAVEFIRDYLLQLFPARSRLDTLPG